LKDKLTKVIEIMKRKNNLEIKGRLLLELFDKDGKLKDRRELKNLIVDTGRAWVIDMINMSSPPARAEYIAIGTGATSPVAGNTTLGTEVARSTLQAGTQPDQYTDRVQATFAAGVGTGTITEAGRFNASSAGTLVGRQTFTGIVKSATDSLQITYDFTI
jgi:hypothetical protein